MRGLHPHLKKVIRRGLKICSCDFTVIEGCRTLERQKRLKASGASKTLRSRHIPPKRRRVISGHSQRNVSRPFVVIDKSLPGYGHAVDIVPWINGTVDWNDLAAFAQVGHAMRVAAMDLGIPITWGAGKMYGGQWSNSFNDMPHFQLTWKDYPA